jgi:NADH dehydrogenase [ubiquinone] 1 alpha subcomplex assembly factor 3
LRTQSESKKLPGAFWLSTMHSPSPQLLRALRSINAFTLRPSPQFGRRVSTPSFQRPAVRSLSSTHYHSAPPPPSAPPKTHNRGPKSDEKTQTDFSTLNVLGDMPPPITAIDACLSDGFHLNNGVKISGGSGVILVDGEAFGWQPWEAPSPTATKDKKAMINAKGQFEVPSEAWGLLEVVWPKPGMIDILIHPL